jgi:hypothetical protein
MKGSEPGSPQVSRIELPDAQSAAFDFAFELESRE